MTRGVGEKHGDLVRALLDATAEALVSEGMESLSLRAVAARAQVSSGAPYHHFKDKRALLAALAHEGFEGLTQALRRFDREEGTARLALLCETYVRFAAGHPAHYGVMFPATPLGAPEIVRIAGESFALLEGCIASCLAPHPAPLRRIAIAIWSSCHGLAQLVASGIVRNFDQEFTVDRAAELAGESARAIVEHQRQRLPSTT